MAAALAAAGNEVYGAEVYGAARFRDAAVREPIEALGVTPARMDLLRGELDDLPEQVDYVLHFAVVKSGK